jgi:hypothetical protein
MAIASDTINLPALASPHLTSPVKAATITVSNCIINLGQFAI